MTHHLPTVIEKEMILMNNIIFLSFTLKGYKLASDIAEKLKDNDLYNISTHRVYKLDEFLAPIFKKGNVIVFVGAVGIAVRAISHFIQNKTIDPAVIVIDEKGQFVIPILSGHIGGANSFAVKISKVINAVPIITTATDINKVFAIDTFATENNYVIINPNRIKDVSSYLLEEKEVGLFSDFEIISQLPPNLSIKNNADVGVVISVCTDKSIFEKTLYLVPKCLHIGIGARKNTSPQQLEEFFLKVLDKLSLPIEGVKTLSSINLKKNEQAICMLSEKYGIPYITYSVDELLSYENLFDTSDFVKKTVGIGNVCETSAYLSSSKGTIIHKKVSCNGMTIAIGKEDWKVNFKY